MLRRHLIDQHIEQREQDALADAQQDHRHYPVPPDGGIPERELQLGAEEEGNPELQSALDRPVGGQVQQRELQDHYGQRIGAHQPADEPLHLRGTGSGQILDER
ncbi:hypothetical protein D3C84_340920 [compost metagenome]